MDALTGLAQASEYSEWLLAPESLTDALMETLDDSLVAALKDLTEAERAVFLLRAMGDLRYREISEALEIPLGSVMGYLSRARGKMRVSILQARRRAQS